MAHSLKKGKTSLFDVLLDQQKHIKQGRLHLKAWLLYQNIS